MSKPLYAFGPFRVDAAQRLLFRGAEVVPLTPKAFDLLLVLVESQGRVLTKDDLMARVWPDVVVEDANLSHHVYKLREAMGDGENGQKYIETLPRRGYRFATAVTEPAAETARPATAAAAAALPPPESPVPPPMRSPVVLVAAALLSIVVLGLLVAAWAARGARPQRPDAARSIAVLPFKALVPGSGDPALELGITDALITKLGNIRELFVRPTTSILKYGGEDQDPAKAGAEMGVDALVAGRVQRSQDRIRLSVQLIRASDGSTLWAGTFDEPFKDIFAVQDSISERIASSLALTLSGDERRGVGKRYTDNLEAYQLYQQGRYHWSTFEPAGLLTSINYFQEALKKDPSYALAYAGLANAYTVMSIWGPMTTKEALAGSRAAARRAVELDDQLSEAHVAMAASLMVNDWDWVGMEAALRRARELNPRSVEAGSLYPYYLEATGRFDEAVTAMRDAVMLAPEWRLLTDDLQFALYVARRYDEAAASCEASIALDPGYYDPYLALGQVRTQQKRYDEAIKLLERGQQLTDQSDPTPLAEIGYVYAVSGRRAEALAVIERLKQYPLSWVPFQIAEIQAGLGDADQAFAWLEKAFEAHTPFLWYVKILPQFDPIRTDPRYPGFLRRLNLSPAP